jgi:dihydrofolate reductase
VLRAYKSCFEVLEMDLMARPTADDPRHGAAVHTAALELVVAVAENDVIGRGNKLPWHLPKDLRRSKALTLGKHILMGRKTYESIGKALPGRTNLVMTRSADFDAADCTVVGTLDSARSAANAGSALMVIGGADVYRQCLPFATRIHLTLVHARIEDGDTFFAGWRDAEWRESSRERHEADDKNDFAFSFITLDRDLAISEIAHG